MHNQPLVSVIVPTYNRATFIEETLDSILSQTYTNIEILVIDDGSTDNTFEILKRYDGKIEVISRENLGESRTVNQGFDLATGKYVCVVNSDDPILKDCFSSLVPILENNPTALVAYGDWVRIGPKHEFIKYEKLKEYTIENMLREVNFGLGPGTLIRKSALEKYGSRVESYKDAGDSEIYLRFALHGELSHTPKVLATHRDHNDSASVSTNKSLIFTEMVDSFYRTMDSPALSIDHARLRQNIVEN